MRADEDEDGEGPEPKTIHRRFTIALLAEALAGAGTVHLDYRVEREPETIHVWEPRRSANDPAPPAPPDSDPGKRFGQAVLGAAMEHGGMVQVPVEIGTEPDFIDLYFEPGGSGPPAPGLLGRMTRAPCLLSPLHATPDADDVRADIFHAHNLWSMQGRTRTKARKKNRHPLVATFQICTEPSAEIREGFGMRRKQGWPPGVYFGIPIMVHHLIVLRELEATRDTLILRLMATGDLLEKALEEQAALPEDAPERRATRAALLAVVPPPGSPIPLERAPKDPVLRACRQTYRKWARALPGSPPIL
jgi:hypothetical protein